MKKLVNYFTPVRFLGDDELLRRARFTIWFLIILFATVGPISAFMIYALPGKLMNTIIGSFFIFLVLFVLFFFRKTGKFWIVSIVLGSLSFVAMILSLCMTGGVYSPDLYSLLIIPLVGLIISDLTIGLVFAGL